MVHVRPVPRDPGARQPRRHRPLADQGAVRLRRDDRRPRRSSTTRSPTPTRSPRRRRPTPRRSSRTPSARSTRSSAAASPAPRSCVFGGGDWEDTLQPVDPAMAERLVSSWTVELAYQTLVALPGRVRAGGAGTAMAAAAGRPHGRGCVSDFNRFLVPGRRRRRSRALPARRRRLLPPPARPRRPACTTA